MRFFSPQPPFQLFENSQNVKMTAVWKRTIKSGKRKTGRLARAAGNEKAKTKIGTAG
jgi:hypothetical protein